MEEEIKMVRVVVNNKFNAYEDLTGNNPNAIFVSQEDLDQIGETKCFDLETMSVVDYDNSEDLERQRLEDLRMRRQPLLDAFDIYKTNVVYGLVKETEEQKTAIVSWYELLLDLDERAFENIPEAIQYYL